MRNKYIGPNQNLRWLWQRRVIICANGATTQSLNLRQWQQHEALIYGDDNAVFESVPMITTQSPNLRLWQQSSVPMSLNLRQCQQCRVESVPMTMQIRICADSMRIRIRAGNHSSEPKFVRKLRVRMFTVGLWMVAISWAPVTWIDISTLHNHEGRRHYRQLQAQHHWPETSPMSWTTQTFWIRGHYRHPEHREHFGHLGLRLC
jgi:hypothetical protein